MTSAQFLAMTNVNYFDIIQAVPGKMLAPWLWGMRRFAGAAYAAGSVIRLVLNGISLSIGGTIATSLFLGTADDSTWVTGSFNVTSLTSGGLNKALSIQTGGASYTTGTGDMEIYLYYYELPQFLIL